MLWDFNLLTLVLLVSGTVVVKTKDPWLPVKISFHCTILPLKILNSLSYLNFIWLYGQWSFIKKQKEGSFPVLLLRSLLSELSHLISCVCINLHQLDLLRHGQTPTLCSQIQMKEPLRLTSKAVMFFWFSADKRLASLILSVASLNRSQASSTLLL